MPVPKKCSSSNARLWVAHHYSREFYHGAALNGSRKRLKGSQTAFLSGFRSPSHGVALLMVEDACRGRGCIIIIITVLAVKLFARIRNRGGSRFRSLRYRRHCNGASLLIGLAYQEVQSIQSRTIHAVPLRTVFRSQSERTVRRRRNCFPAHRREKTAAFHGRGTFFVRMTTLMANVGIAIIPGGGFGGSVAFGRVECYIDCRERRQGR